VAAANNIVAELAWTNSLLECSIMAAEGSRASVDQMCNGLNLFLQQQREFQAMFLGGLRMGLRTESDEVQKSSDVEKEDEEMNKEDGSEEGASGGTDESMDM
ncbi:hypothetical protein P692DRAFT_20754246, partial [Suillus brevipes Sb2]